jgi:tetratricopeptide (TPR) repeat protein
VKTESTEHLKPRSQYADEAVQLAIAGQWEEAAELNRMIIDKLGPDDQTQNRLGKALSELGKLEEAKAAYEASLALNPMNSVAQKNAAKLETLLQTKAAIGGGPAKVDLNLFVEEMGKTVTTMLEGSEPELCTKVVAGDLAELRIEGDGIAAETVRGVGLGSVEPKLARRLINFIQGGNRYQAGVTSCEGSSVKVIIREVYQDPKFAGKPSFPMRRKREVDFRPYTKESLLTREVGAFSGDEDEDELETTAAGSDLDLEGMHEVEDEAETLDFAEEEPADEADDDDEDDE